MRLALKLLSSHLKNAFRVTWVGRLVYGAATGHIALKNLPHAAKEVLLQTRLGNIGMKGLVKRCTYIKTIT